MPLAPFQGQDASDLGVEVVVEHKAVLGDQLELVAGFGQVERGRDPAAFGVDHIGHPVGAVRHEDVPCRLGHTAQNIAGLADGHGEATVVLPDAGPDQCAGLAHRGVDHLLGAGRQLHVIAAANV